MEAGASGSQAADHAVKTMASAFRMAERDFEAALKNGENLTQGPERNLFAIRIHMRTSPRLLAKINKHLQAIEDLLTSEMSRKTDPTPDDQHLSLTIALLPLKGRGKTEINRGG